MTNKAAILKEAKSSLTIEDRPIPTPTRHQILVKNHAVAINPVEALMQQTGFFIKSYPVILGTDVAGTVEAVGPEVKHFKKGDRIAGFASAIANGKLDDGAFQQYPLLTEGACVKLPDNVSFEQGATLPMAVATSGCAIFLCLEIPRFTTKQTGGFLVWGGSSSVGTAAVQIASALGFKVFAVASKHNHEYVKSLGATGVFDYNDPSVVKHIKSAAKEVGVEIKYAYDAVSTSASLPYATAVLEDFGGGKLATVLPWPEDVKKSDKVTASQTAAFRIITDQPEFGRWLFNDWLQKSLADKTYVPSPGVEVVKGGIEGIENAINQHAKGVSGKKIVVPLV